MSTKLNLTKDIAGYNGFGLAPTTDIKRTTLTANAAQSVTVPSNYQNWLAIFSYTPGASVWVRFDGSAATLPTGTFASAASVLNPAGRAVVAGQTISVITDDATDPAICIEFQVINPYVN